MDTAVVAEVEPAADIAREVLDGLARLHHTVLVLDLRGNVTWLQDSAGLLSHLPPGATVCNIATPLFDPSRYDELRQRLSSQGQIVNERLDLPQADGGCLAVEISVTRPCDSPHLVALLRPVADRQERERQLRDTIEHLGAILGAAPEVVLAVDRDGFVTYANAASEALLGYAPEEIVDKPISAYVTSASELGHIAAVLQPEGRSFTRDIEFRRKDEAIVRVSVSGSRLCLPSGAGAGAVLMLHDVTERRRFEAELSRKNVELEHYVHTVSHDLRTPLASLLGFARLLREDYASGLGKQGCHFLERIVQAGRRMETLTNDLLELSSIGDRSERRALVDPKRVLMNVQEELKPRLQEHGTTLVLPENPPLVLCDRTRLYQVFANLVGNALDHMGEVDDPRIVVGVQERSDGHLISVSDNGDGIHPDHHERIFKIFQSLGSRRDGRRGTGVGLAIVRKIAETHGGRVWVESEPARGATFHFLLPRA